MKFFVPSTKLDPESCPRVSTAIRELLRDIARQYDNSGKPDKITLSFEETSYIEVSDLAALCCAIRRMAENGITVSLIAPIYRSKFFHFLASFRLRYLFRPIGIREDWQNRVEFLEQWESGNSISRIEKVVPLHWVDQTLFTIDSQQPLYEQEPSLSETFVDDLKSLLDNYGILSDEFIEEFAGTIIRELAWNTVLHSSPNKKNFGVFCARVRPSKRSALYSIVDLGRGIVDSLGKAYTAQDSQESNRSTQSLGQTRDESILAFSIERFSTSRSFSTDDARIHTDRGLYLVSELSRQKGGLVIQSANAELGLSAVSRATKLHPMTLRFPGTAISGVLTAEKSPTAKKRSSRAIEPRLVALPEILAILAGDYTYKSYTPDTRALRDADEVLLLDMGFLDPNANYLVQAIIQNPFQTVIIVNAKHSASFRIHALAEVMGDLPNRILIISHFAICHLYTLDGRRATGPVICRLPSESLCNFMFRVQSSMLESGFSDDRKAPGFWSGRIYQQNGTCVSRYFSLYEYTTSRPSSRNIDRWYDVLASLLADLLEPKELANTTLVGFAASMRPILKRIPTDNPIRKRTYILNSYDTPSKVEIKESLELTPGTRVVLCTDVVSSGSLLTSIINACLAAGAFIRGIICLVHAVDTREGFKATWAHGSHSFPFLRGSKLIAPPFKSDPAIRPDYWADPVSAVPLPYPSAFDYIPNRFESTARFLTESDAIQFGHFRRGIYHTSVKIDFRAFEVHRAKIERSIEISVMDALKSAGWTDFNPSVLVHAQGQERIDKLDSDSDPEQSSVRELISLTLRRMSSGGSGSVSTLGVPRLFEPGGRAHVAPISFELSNGKSKDVIIFDHVMGTGGTLRSLMNQVLRAGAKRILVFPLVVRCSSADLEEWQALREVGLDEHVARVAFSFSYFLPAIYHVASSCPQCHRISSLSTPSASSPLWFTQSEESIRKESEIGSRASVLVDSSSFTDAWLNIHGLLELSDGSVLACDRLNQLIAELHDAGESKKDAFLSLLLRESNLFEKPFIRRNRDSLIIPLLQSFVQGSSDSLFCSKVLSVMRMLSPDQYLFFVSENLQQILEFQASILPRMLHHIFTIKAPNVQQRSVLATNILAAINKRRDSSVPIEVHKILESWAEGTTGHATSIQVLSRLKQSLLLTTVRHNIVGVLDELRLLDKWDDDGFVGDKGEFLYQTWVSRARPAFNKTVVANLAYFQRISEAVRDYYSDFSWDYFNLEASDGTHLLSDLEMIGQLLRLRRPDTATRVRGQLKAFSEKLLSRIFEGPDSLTKLLQSFELSASFVIERIREQLSSIVDVNPINHQDFHQRRVLVPLPLVDEFCRLVKSNLISHSPSLCRMPINLHVSSESGLSERCMRVQLEVSQTPCRELRLSIMSRMLELSMQEFGGNFHPFERGAIQNFFGPSLTVRFSE